MRDRDELLEILRELVADDHGVVDEGKWIGGSICNFCESDLVTGTHSPDCVVVRARRLLEDLVAE